MGVTQYNLTLKKIILAFMWEGDWRGEEWEQRDQLACQGMRLELPGLGQQHWRQIGSLYFQGKVSKNFQCI